MKMFSLPAFSHGMFLILWRNYNLKIFAIFKACISFEIILLVLWQFYTLCFTHIHPSHLLPYSQSPPSHLHLSNPEFPSFSFLLSLLILICVALLLLEIGAVLECRQATRGFIIKEMWSLSLSTHQIPTDPWVMVKFCILIPLL